jgi:hypothetical protein
LLVGRSARLGLGDGIGFRDCLPLGRRLRSRARCRRRLTRDRVIAHWVCADAHAVITFLSVKLNASADREALGTKAQHVSTRII